MGDNQSYNHHQRVPNRSLESNHPTGFKDSYHHRQGHDYRNMRMDDNQPYPNEYNQRAAPNKSLDANNHPINRNIYHHRRHDYRKEQWTIDVFSHKRI